MKIGKHLLTVLLTIPAFLATAGAAGEAQRPRQLKSGIVEYTLNTSGMGSTESGTKTEWFDDYGNRTATLEKSTTTTKIFGSESTEVKEELTIMDGDTVYTINLREQTGTKADIGEMKKMGAAMAGRMAGPGGVQNSKEFVEKNGGKWLPAETFLGRKCDVVEMMGVRTWTYKGVTLKTEGAMMGITTTQVAKKFEENVRVPASKFEVPAGIEFETQEMPAEAAAMMQALMGGGTDEDGEMPASLAQLMQQAQDESGDEADDEADWPDLRLSVVEFREIVAAFKMNGYQQLPLMHSKKQYGLVHVKGDAVVSVGVTPTEALDGMTEDEDYKVLSRFKHAGYSAELLEIREEGDEMDGEPVGPPEISSGVAIRMPRKGCVLMVVSKPKRSKAEMMKLLEMLDL